MIARVSFATGWTREYVLHSLTFAELVRYAEYTAEHDIVQARYLAVQIGLLFGAVKVPAPGDERDAGDGGVAELIRRNTKCQT